MAPRNNDAEGNYKKSECPDDIKTTLPCLMHKKHKVVKLVKSQLLKIQQEGLLRGISGSDFNLSESDILERADFTSAGPSKNDRFIREADHRVVGDSETSSGSENPKNVSFICYFLALIFTVLLIVFLIVWVSAGPLSNSMAHTPISPSAFVRTDSICSLEKKYLLRWSKPQYFE